MLPELEAMKAFTDDYLQRVYKRVPLEQNWERRRREQAQFQTDTEMFKRLRDLVSDVEQKTQSQSQRAQALEAIAWIDARQGGL